MRGAGVRAEWCRWLGGGRACHPLPRSRQCSRCLRTSRPDSKVSPRKHGSSSPLLSPLSHPDFLKELMTNSVSASSCPAAGFPVSSVSTWVVTVPAKVTRPSTSALLVPVHPSVWPPSPPPYPDQKTTPSISPATARTSPVCLILTLGFLQAGGSSPPQPASRSLTSNRPCVCLLRVARTIFQESHCHSKVSACNASRVQAKGEK